MPQEVQTLNVDLPVDLARRLDQYCRMASHRNKSDIVREALDIWLSDHGIEPTGGE